MEVLHLDILRDSKEQERFDFLRGKDILSWYGIKQRRPFDVEHPQLKSILRGVKDKQNKGLYYIQHEPGVGGTTFARRLAWDLHSENPTVILRDYRDGDRVFKKLEKIHEKARERFYIIANVPQAISLDELKELNNRLNSRQLPYLIIAVGREVSSKPNSSLTNWGNECVTLINEFKEFLPQLGYSTRAFL